MISSKYFPALNDRVYGSVKYNNEKKEMYFTEVTLPSINPNPNSAMHIWPYPFNKNTVSSIFEGSEK